MADMLAEEAGGIFLVPGVSKNKRLYTREMIAKAVARMQKRITDPDGLPIAMRTHHDAKDNSRLIVGRVTAVEQDDEGRGRFKYRWYNTAPARDIAELVRPADGGPPGLRSVSIHGWFMDPKQVQFGGESVTTGGDLEVDFIDFTGSPGVTGALIDPPNEPAESVAAPPGCLVISETWEDPMPETETGQVEPVVDEAYTAAQKRDALDAGQAMKNAKGEPSYTIKNKADLRRAIRAVGRGNADHDAIRKHVIARAKALGLSAMIPDNWNADGSLKETAPATRFGEIRECYGDGPAGAGFAIDAYNGPVSLTLRAPSLDPSSLRAVATAAMGAALSALGALDPDFDADIDVPGAPAEDTDGDMATDAEAGAPGDPDAATPDDDEEAYQPGSGCPCGCGCAVPDGMVGGSGCPCACGCEVCGAAAESAPARATGGPVEATQVVLVGETGPEVALPDEPGGHVAPQDAAPEPPALTETAPSPEPAAETNTQEESAVSETTPAAEAATTPTPEAPAAAPAGITFSPEQFTQLLAAIRPPVAETAPAAPVAAPVEQPAPTAPEAQTATEQAPVTAQVGQVDIAETIAAAVAQAMQAAIPTLRDEMVSKYGLPPRTGIRTTESDGNAAEMTREQLWDNRADLLLGNLGKTPA